MLTCLLLIVLSGIAQTKYIIDGVQSGRYINNRWKFDETESVKMKITIVNKVIYVSDVADSHYTIIKDIGEDNTADYKSYDWKCIDEKGRRCNLSIVKYFDSGSFFLITYNDVCYKYFIAEALDNL